MTAHYKRKRMVEHNSTDNHVKHINFEPSNRQLAKKEIKSGLHDHIDLNDIQLKAEIQWEEEMRMANECYLRELADPENYKCTCGEK